MVAGGYLVVWLTHVHFGFNIMVQWRIILHNDAALCFAELGEKKGRVIEDCHLWNFSVKFVTQGDKSFFRN